MYCLGHFSPVSFLSPSPPSLSGRIMVLIPVQENSSQDLISKINRAKWTGSVIQATECLLCKNEALSSNPSLTKKERQNVAHTCNPSSSGDGGKRISA
jgi:hypothetical protein